MTGNQPNLDLQFAAAGYETGECVVLNNTLIEHGISDFYEASDVGADYEIAGLPVLFRSVPGDFEDRRHDVT